MGQLSHKYYLIPEDGIPVSDGLVHYYPLNGDFLDKVGTLNGTSSGTAPTSANNRFSEADKAYYFTPNSAIRLSYDIISCTNGSPFSISVWAKPTNFISNFYPTICHLKTDTSYPLRLFITPSVVGFLSYSNWGLVAKSFTFDPNVWHHFVVTYDGTAINNTGTCFQLFVDKVDTSNTFGGSSGTASYNLSEIGGASATANGNFDGSIDEFRIYNRVLTQEEIDLLYEI